MHAIKIIITDDVCFHEHTSYDDCLNGDSIDGLIICLKNIGLYRN